MKSAIGPDTFCFFNLAWPVTPALRRDLRAGSICVDTEVPTVSV